MGRESWVGLLKEWRVELVTEGVGGMWCWWAGPPPHSAPTPSLHPSAPTPHPYAPTPPHPCTRHSYIPALLHITPLHPHTLFHPYTPTPLHPYTWPRLAFNRNEVVLRFD